MLFMYYSLYQFVKYDFCKMNIFSEINIWLYIYIKIFIQEVWSFLYIIVVVIYMINFSVFFK